MDAYIIDAWMRRDDREDDDAYEGRMNLGPPNNVAVAVEHENQCTASATTPLAMSANKEEVCAAGAFCSAEANNNVNKSTHRCLNCRGRIHCAMFCGKNWGDYADSANCQITPNQLSAAGRAAVRDGDHELITICSMCINNLEGAPSLDEPHAEDETAAALASSISQEQQRQLF
jgi:hypothetical protein